MINYRTTKLHWNYFLAIESDLKMLSRYIEFTEVNQATYSIELAHILLSASSEIDVVLKMICGLLKPTGQFENIDDYRETIAEKIPDFTTEQSCIPRYGLSYQPWINWNNGQNPVWWRSYNKVKHERNTHYHEANLKNTICAVGGLLIALAYYYRLSFSKEQNRDVDFQDVIRNLDNSGCFVKLQEAYYSQFLIA
jgi:hypothetical protein